MVIHRINVRRLNPSGIVKLLNLNDFFKRRIGNLISVFFSIFNYLEKRRAEGAAEQRQSWKGFNTAKNRFQQCLQYKEK